MMRLLGYCVVAIAAVGIFAACGDEASTTPPGEAESVESTATVGPAPTQAWLTTPESTSTLTRPPTSAPASTPNLTPTHTSATVPTPTSPPSPTPTPIPPPSADFSVDVLDGVAPLTVNFSPTSTGEVSAVRWDFGDGSHSEETSPVHEYTTAGEFDVELRVEGPGGNDAVVRSQLITVRPGLPVSFIMVTENLEVRPKQSVQARVTATDKFGNSVSVKPDWEVANGGGDISTDGILHRRDAGRDVHRYNRCVLGPGRRGAYRKCRCGCPAGTCLQRRADSNGHLVAGWRRAAVLG